MKKLLLLTAISFSMLAVNAQFGIKAGGNLSKWHGSDISSGDVDPLFGYYFGAFYNASIVPEFSVQPELVFAATGAKSSSSSDKVRSGYLNLSVIPRYNHESGWFIGTGPELSFLLSAKDKYDGSSDDIKDEFKGTNFSWDFMTGFNFKGGFGVHTNYSLGLTDIFKNGGKVKQSVWGFGVHYNFSMTGKK